MVLLWWVTPLLASGACPAESGVQLLRQQLLPGSPAYYLACGLPAASLQARQIAIADGDGAVAPSACAMQVCVFDSVSGKMLSRWSLTAAPAGVDLGVHLQPLMDSLRAQAFQPMRALLRQKQGSDAMLTDGSSQVVLQFKRGSAFLVARKLGYAEVRHRFKPRTMRCQAHPDRRVLPQEVRAWSLDSIAVFAIAADYLGAEPGCSWTEWLVLPMKPEAHR